MRLSLGLLLLWGIVGCGSAPDKPLPKTVPVKGKLTLDGQPLKGATVTFYPTGSTRGIECMGVSDDAGAYELKQVRGGPGAPPGEYAVTVSLLLKKDGSPVSKGEKPIDVNASESLPPRYSVMTETTLKANVSESGGPVDFQLVKKMP